MLEGLFLLLLCQMAGEALVRGLALPIPGPVAGIALMMAGLALAGALWRRDPSQSGPLATTADGLLRHLGLLFVPAGVGIVQHWHLITAHGVAIAAALIGSTLMTLLATVYTFRLVSRAVGADAAADETPSKAQGAP